MSDISKIQVGNTTYDLKDGHMADYLVAVEDVTTASGVTWHCLKYNSGLWDCYAKYELDSLNITTSWESLYTGYVGSFSFPKTASTVYHCSASVDSALTSSESNLDLMLITRGASSTTRTPIYLVSRMKSESAAKVTLALHIVIG